MRALHGMHEESISTLEPNFSQHVIRHIFRVRRREVPNHVEYKLGLCERRIRLGQPLCEGDLKFLAGRFLPQRKMAFVHLGKPVFTLRKLHVRDLEREADLKGGLGKASAGPDTSTKAVATTAQIATRFI